MQKDDVPAAFPLIAFVAGLLASRYALAFLAIAVLLLSIRRVRLALAVLALAGGAAAGASQASRLAVDRSAFAHIDHDHFVRIVATLDHDWMRRGDTNVLTVPGFSADGVQFHRPLRIYLRDAASTTGFHRQIVAEGFLRQSEQGDWLVTVKSPRLIAYRGELSRWNPVRWNRVAAMRLEQFVPTHASAVALAEALALGRSERLDEAVREHYKRGGTYHLLVFSGLQIALAAGLIAMLLRWLRSPRAADWSLLALAVLAPLFIGPTASVCRASISIALFAASRIAHRPTSLANLWCLSALVRLAFAPADLIDAAFQLTYTGSGALLFAVSPLTKGKRSWAAAAVAAELCITPLTLFHFHQYSIGGSLATLALSPVIVAMLAVSLLVAVFPSHLLLTLIEGMDRCCVAVNQWSASGSGIFAAPPAASMIAGFTAALLAVTFLRGRSRAVAILACAVVPLTGAIVRDARARDVETPHLIALDVGQGDAILVRSGSHNLLVDGGPGNLILPLLADRGVRHLDIVLLTHAHPDHCSGMVSVVERLDVGSLWLSPQRLEGDCAVRLLEAARLREVPIHLVRQHDAGMAGGIRITTLRLERGTRHSPENNSSVVVRLQIEGIRALLTGDIEREAERELLPELRSSQILKVAHHGSRTSSSVAFLECVNPRVALISCGRRNLFGHPHPAVLANLHARGVRVMRTDIGGTIDLELANGRIAFHPEIDTPR